MKRPHAGGDRPEATVLPMHLWRHGEPAPANWQRCVVTIGVFDGVHLGHRRIIDSTVARAREAGLPAVAITFDPHPAVVVRPDAAPPMLSTIGQRARLLGERGIDVVYVLGFTRELSQLEPEQFAQLVLADTLHAAAVVVGADFRFGHKAAGDVVMLGDLGRRLGFDVESVALVGPHEAGRWSSTWVRQRLAAGDVEGAAGALGRPYRLAGVVVRGDGRGRGLGYPTANIEVTASAAVPADGVYAGRLHGGGAPEAGWPAAVSIGTNPTFDGTQRRVEAHVLGRDDLELYGAQVELDVIARLRGMERFDGVEALVEQMGRDVDQARQVLGA